MFLKISAKKQSFFELSANYRDPSSLRRILSLLRIEDQCKTIIRTDCTIKIGTEEISCSNKTNSRLCVSCYDYINHMRECSNNYTLVEKTCSKLFFFSCEMTEDEKVNKEKHQEHFLGYSIIHLDKLKKINGDEGKEYTRSYVPECVLSRLSKSVRGYKYGNFNCDIVIDEQNFEIVGGNYFSQQNGITNCCAHAAIKTALRGYDSNFACDKINNAIIDFRSCSKEKKAAEIARMARGLTPTEMLTAIQKISNNSTNIKPLAPFLITAHDLPVTSFVETIYRAIESKLPVILLLRIPDNVAIANSFKGHAVSLVGHTFNQHNWCAYGSGYFSGKNIESFLSSYLWCDNYIVQDDNFGPAYHIPCSFLADYYEYGVTIEKFGLNIASQKELNNLSPNYPLAAIIVPPAGLENLTKNLYYYERIAVKLFVEQINRFGRKNRFIFSKEEKIKFDRYFYYIFKYKCDKPRVFITRTLLVSKREYIESSVKDIYNNNFLGEVKLTTAIEDLLPNYFWLTEISVPELYWVNKAKIGEIIVDFNAASSDQANIRLIRLPYFLAFYPQNDDEYYAVHITQTEPHQPNLKKTEGIIRQFSQ